MDTALPGGYPLRQRLRGFIEQSSVQRTIIALILINAAILGLETSPTVMASVGWLLAAADRVILGVFVVEIAIPGACSIFPWWPLP